MSEEDFNYLGLHYYVNKSAHYKNEIFIFQCNQTMFTLLHYFVCTLFQWAKNTGLQQHESITEGLSLEHGVKFSKHQGILAYR